MLAGNAGQGNRGIVIDRQVQNDEGDSQEEPAQGSLLGPHFAAEKLARFKVPSQVFLRAEPLPRTATGKVLKRDLRDELTKAGS